MVPWLPYNHLLQVQSVKSECEDLRKENSKLRKVKAALDAKLAEPVGSPEGERRQSAGNSGALPPSPREGRDQDYPQTWRLVDQLRKQNRSAKLALQVSSDCLAANCLVGMEYIFAGSV